MFFNAHVLKPFEGAAFAENDTPERNNKIRADNKRIIIMQRFGMGLLSLSFVFQGVALYLG